MRNNLNGLLTRLLCYTNFHGTSLLVFRLYMLQCKCETGGFANTLNSWWIRENSGANAKPFYLKSYGRLIYNSKEIRSIYTISSNTQLFHN